MTMNMKIQCYPLNFEDARRCTHTLVDRVQADGEGLEERCMSLF